MGVGITQDKANCCEKVTLAGTITPNDDIVFGGKRLDDCLILVAKVIRVSRLFPRAIRGARNCSAYLLKPWMIICLTYMLKDARRDDHRTPRIPRLGAIGRNNR